MFAGRVDADASVPFENLAAADVDDCAGASSSHGWQDGLNGSQRAVKVGREQGLRVGNAMSCVSGCQA